MRLLSNAERGQSYLCEWGYISSASGCFSGVMPMDPQEGWEINHE